MTKSLKIGLTISGIIMLTTFMFIAGGLYTMEIEDHYGDNQEIFYKSRKGDIAVNKDTKEIRTIEKNWNRIYTIDTSDTVDMWLWLHKNRIEIYRATIDGITAKTINYEDIDNLIGTEKIELIIQNR